jgi:hypothetical protein
MSHGVGSKESAKKCHRFLKWRFPTSITIFDFSLICLFPCLFWDVEIAVGNVVLHLTLLPNHQVKEVFYCTFDADFHELSKPLARSLLLKLITILIST